MAKLYSCGVCGEPMQREAGTVHYTESGLDNVELRNVPVWRCRNGHEDVQIPAIPELHRLLAGLIVSQPWPLKGRDVRFLRKHQGYSARAFSELIGVNHVTLSRFENDHRTLPRKLEALVRLFFAQVLCEQTNQPLPRPLIPVLEQLESGVFERELRIDLIESPRAVPRHAWHEAVA